MPPAGWLPVHRDQLHCHATAFQSWLARSPTLVTCCSINTQIPVLQNQSQIARAAVGTKFLSPYTSTPYPWGSPYPRRTCKLLITTQHSTNTSNFNQKQLGPPTNHIALTDCNTDWTLCCMVHRFLVFVNFPGMPMLASRVDVNETVWEDDR